MRSCYRPKFSPGLFEKPSRAAVPKTSDEHLPQAIMTRTMVGMEKVLNVQRQKNNVIKAAYDPNVGAGEGVGTCRA